MTISYKWLCEYLPIGTQLPSEWVEPEKLSKILTAVGLEVESLEYYESFKGGLKDVYVGEVMTCEKHPNADKLSLTTVSVGQGNALQIVCGAPNVAAGQKVIVATVGAIMHPLTGEAFAIKKAKIRGVESEGMLCAEDEIGLSGNHDGIMVLPSETQVGTPAAQFFNLYSDWIYEIGLTPNRMDAMSHLGVARDVCAYLSHHYKKHIQVQNPLKHAALPAGAKVKEFPVSVEIENPASCQRYAGVTLAGVQVSESPQWLKNKLKSIGLRPINNVVDVTNFILHETGQPLHAFDANKIPGAKVRVKNLPEETLFTTLDEKERKLLATDLMICDDHSNPLCIAGVYGGLDSGVHQGTENIFLESAWFHPVSIRRSSFEHGLRTDAATRFEKGVDISQTAAVLKRAAALIIETGGGHIASELVDVYPHPQEKKQVAIKFHYLKKLSGKNYHPDSIKGILESLGFEFLKEGRDDLWFAVPFSKPDISFPADLVEEIMRIDGYDNVEIPTAITITPSADLLGPEEALKEKVADYLVGLGFAEMLTNSITNKKYYTDEVLNSGVQMLNNLSADLNMLRPSMLESTLETLVHNLNRKNNHLQFFEFGKTYHSQGLGSYTEQKHLVITATGNRIAAHWHQAPVAADLFFMKGVVANLLAKMELRQVQFTEFNNKELHGLEVLHNGRHLGYLGTVSTAKLNLFGIRQPVWYADLNWNECVTLSLKQQVTYKELPRFPSAERDVALVLDKSIPFEKIAATVKRVKLPLLKNINLFDVFESEKLGADKKSMAVNFIFQDDEKTMTESEIEDMMTKLRNAFAEDLGAEIRK